MNGILERNIERHWRLPVFSDTILNSSVKNNGIHPEATICGAKAKPLMNAPDPLP